MQCEHICACKHFIQPLGDDLSRLKNDGRKIGIIGNADAPKVTHALMHRLCDTSETDGGKDCIAQRTHREGRRDAPNLVTYTAINEWELPGESQDHGHGVVRHFVDAIIGYVANWNTALRRLRQRDIIDTDAEAYDNFALPQR